MEMEVFERTDFLIRVAQIFAGLIGENIVRIDASKPQEVVLTSALAAVRARWGL